MPNSVYDPKSDEQHAPVQNEDASDTTPSPKTYDPRQDGSMHDKSDPRAEGSSAPDSSPVSKRGLYNAEKDGSTDKGSGDDSDTNKDGLFSPDDGRQNKSLRNRLKGKVTRKKAAVGAAAFGGIAGISIVMTLATVPLKMESMVENFQKQFFSSASDATEKAERKLFVRYVQKHVLPSYKNCRSTIDRTCGVKIIGNGKNPVSNMYRAWADARLETRLAEDYGLEFKLEKNGGGGAERWIVKSPGDPKGTDIESDGSKLSSVVERTDQAGVRDALDRGLDGETHWKKTWYHYKVGRLLEQKYGIRRCLAFCGKTDQFQEFKREKKNAAKILLTQRVITPRTETLGVVMECLISSSCDPNKSPASTEPGNSELEGVEQTNTERKAQENFGKLASTYGLTDKAVVEKMIKDYNEIAEKGYSKFILEKILAKVGLAEISDNVTAAVPIFGWINRAATVITALHEFGPFLKMATYITNAPAAVSTYMAYRSFSDEIHTGHVDSEEVGSFVDSLGPGNHGDKNDPIVGGTAGAEQTPLYHAINQNGSKSSSTTLIDTFLPTKAFAASSSKDSQTYLCEDGNPPPAPDLVCSEEKLGNNGNATFDGITNVLDTPPLSLVTTLAGGWHKFFSGIFNVVGAAVGDVLGPLGLNKLTDFVSGIVTPLFDILAKKIVPNPFGSNMSGGRTYDMAAAGASVAGKDSCDQIGCSKVDPSYVASIIDEHKATDKRQFDQQPMFARMFDTSNSNSLVTKVAVAIPFNYQLYVPNNLANIMSNPFGTFLGSFGSIFSDNNAFAGTNVNAVDPFNIGTSGFPDIPDDPEAAWDSRNCDDTSSDGPVAKWQAAATNSDKTGMPEHSTTEPCLLIKAATGAGGGNYDKSLLTEDDRSYAGGEGSSNTSASAGSTGTITGNAVEIAQQIIDQAKAGKVSYSVLYPSDSSDGSTPEANIKEIADGKPAKTTSNCSGRGAQPPNASVAIDPDLLKFILDVSRSQKVIINALAGQCHSSSSSMHYRGKAVDFGCPFDGAIGDKIGKKYGVVDTTGEYCSNASHYHYSVGGG